MIFIIVTIFLGVLLVLSQGLPAVLGATNVSSERNEEAREAGKNVGRFARWVIRGIVAFIMVAMIIGGSIKQVPAGHVGLVYTFGDITGQREAGFQLIWPWQGFKTATIQVQTLCFMDESENNKCPEGSRKVAPGLDSFSSETQNVYIDVIVNIEVSPTEVQDLYRRVGADYVSKLIPGRVAQIFKDETVNYTAVNLAPSREQIRHNVEVALRAEMQPYSIGVVALLVENIYFDAEFDNAILAKQVASQEAQRQQELVAAREAEARQVAAVAQGAADALRIEAEGQADANRLITASITPLLIQWQAIQKLADNIQIALIPSGEGIIIDPATLLGITP